MNKDHHGYYIAGNYKTYSKFEALEYAHRNKTTVKWIFNEDSFSKHPWHINTHKNIKDLYKERAEQIRNKYDYIILLYSGGADSFTVANSFIENKIHIDEIVTFHTHQIDKTWDNYNNKEIKEVAIPQVKKWLDVLPHTKHRLFDLSSIITSMYNIDNNKFDFIYKCNSSLGPHKLALSYLGDVPDWRKIIDSGRTICFVHGCDKPPVRYDNINNKYYLQFVDLIDGASRGPAIQLANQKEENDELFFWSPDATELLTRQAHIVVDYLRNPPRCDLDSIYLTKDPYIRQISNNGQYVPLPWVRPSTVINNTTYYLSFEGLHRLIYPGWREDTFTLGKNFSRSFSIKDAGWWRNYHGKDQTIVRTAIESYFKKFTDLGFNFYRDNKEKFNLDFSLANIDHFFSKRYYLEPLVGNINKLKHTIDRRHL
jgi:hypothetical protein